MGKYPLRLAQVSDLHLFADTQQTLLGVNTHESFQAVFSLLEQQKNSLDLIVLTGDLSQDGSRESYERLANLLNQLNIPVYFIPGNHDDPKILSEIYPTGMISGNKHLVFKKWQLIFLDSQIPGSVEGKIDSSQIRLLQTALKMYPEHHAAVFMHHHPVLVGSQWLDKLGLKNPEDVFAIMRKDSMANTMVFGHVHQVYDQTHDGIRCISAPSTCFQFKRNSDHFALEKLAPGFRKIIFHDNGQVETDIMRTSNYVGIFNENAKGY